MNDPKLEKALSGARQSGNYFEVLDVLEGLGDAEVALTVKKLKSGMGSLIGGGYRSKEEGKPEEEGSGGGKPKDETGSKKS